MRKSVVALVFSVLPAMGLPACSGESPAAASSRGCAWEEQVIAPGASVKVDCNTCSCGPGGLVACTAHTCVNPTPLVPDAGGKSAFGVDGDVATACALPMALTFGPMGGQASHVDRFTLDRSGRLTLARAWNQALSDAGPSMCQLDLPACGTRNAVTLATVSADLADREVQAAFAEVAPLFGVDTRPVDGTVFLLERADGKRILVGEPCGEEVAACRAIPPGVATLVADLATLADWMMGAPACQPR